VSSAASLDIIDAGVKNDKKFEWASGESAVSSSLSK